LLKKITANSLLAYFYLAFIAMAGGIGFSDAEAGQLVSFNGYGGLVGSIAGIFIVGQIRWRLAMFTFFPTLEVLLRVYAVFSSVGLASGPLLASSLIDRGNFSMML